MEIALLLIMNKCISIYNSRHFPPQLINGSLITTVDDVSSRFFLPYSSLVLFLPYVFIQSDV